eukprot:CAMPEP_0176321626 /NCGR_PEP_ID=MMETSP0121_2-20121125/71450_1 /TAXON_ID=160619 /ORGANISM="Kryptoperidinium foliaceum, Strain CCMP 1326" /LENGTH=150 /DNA_ID=CAMNT_0017664083 /DNA_START=12 /DNA_END=464 /DNA_ORIENTATION=-
MAPVSKVPRVAAAAILGLLGLGAEGHPAYVALIPNGDKVERNGESWAAAGHANAAGDGALNPFGEAFEKAGAQWTKELCEADSDGDGQSNGHELGDPNCTWSGSGVAARTTDISLGNSSAEGGALIDAAVRPGVAAAASLAALVVAAGAA